MSLIDVYGLGNANEASEWKLVDVSDEVQFYFEILAKGSNIPSQSISVSLRNKLSNKNIASIEFVDKNVIKFIESRSGVNTAIKNLNEKYELIWCISDNERSGIVYFDQPICFDVK